MLVLFECFDDHWAWFASDVGVDDHVGERFADRQLQAFERVWLRAQRLCVPDYLVAQLGDRRWQRERLRLKPSVDHSILLPPRRSSHAVVWLVSRVWSTG